MFDSPFTPPSLNVSNRISKRMEQTAHTIARRSNAERQAIKQRKLDAAMSARNLEETDYFSIFNRKPYR